MSLKLYFNKVAITQDTVNHHLDAEYASPIDAVVYHLSQFGIDASDGDLDQYFEKLPQAMAMTGDIIVLDDGQQLGIHVGHSMALFATDDGVFSIIKLPAQFGVWRVLQTEAL